MILVLTGPPASGKSTVGPLVANQLDRSVVIDVDLVRGMVKQPHVPPWVGQEGERQLRLGAENGSMLAIHFSKAGFNVILLDVLTDETAQIYRTTFKDVDHKIVVMLPSLEESIQRNRERGQWLKDKEVALLYEWQCKLTGFDDKIDNSDIPVNALAQKLRGYFGS